MLNEEYIIVLNVIEYLHAIIGPEPEDKECNFLTYGVNGKEIYTQNEINQILYN